MISSLLSSLSLFLLFGYLEKTLSMGWIVSGAMVLLALRTSGSLLFSASTMALVSLFMLQFSLSNSSTFAFCEDFRLGDDMFVQIERQRVSGLVFLAITCLYLRVGRSRESELETEDEVSVQFAPHEQEVRKYLLQHDPGMLHKVDSLLQKYKDREIFLMQKLKKKYEGGEEQGLISPLLQRSAQKQSPRQRDSFIGTADKEVTRQQLQQQQNEEHERRLRHYANVQYQLQQVYDDDCSESDSNSAVGSDSLAFEDMYEKAVYNDENDDDYGAGPFSRRGRSTPEMQDYSPPIPQPSVSSLHDPHHIQQQQHEDQWQEHQWQQQEEDQWQQQQQQQQQQQLWQEQQWQDDRVMRMQEARRHAREQLQRQREARARGARY